MADRHLGLVEGVRGLLETRFEAVVVVGDEVSLFESARELHVAMAVLIAQCGAETVWGPFAGSGAISRC